MLIYERFYKLFSLLAQLMDAPEMGNILIFKTVLNDSRTRDVTSFCLVDIFIQFKNH